jgi:hypothetical protein
MLATLKIILLPFLDDGIAKCGGGGDDGDKKVGASGGSAIWGA